ncbi:hypothetical protein H8959_021161 [Pygathrix nigripes]
MTQPAPLPNVCSSSPKTVEFMDIRMIHLCATVRLYETDTKHVPRKGKASLEEDDQFNWAGASAPAPLD